MWLCAEGKHLPVHSYELAEFAVYAFIAVNLVTFCTFGWDKICAENGVWRISEEALLLWAIFGGTPAAYLARSAFRHKTRKQPFSNQLHTIAIMQTALIAVALGYIWLEPSALEAWLDQHLSTPVTPG